MNRSENPAAAMPYEMITYFAKFKGAGAFALVVAPTTFSSTSSIGFMHVSNNFASVTAADHTRSGAGAYTVKLSDTVPVVLNIVPTVWGPDGKRAQIADYNPSTRVATVLTWDAAGVAADLAATDFLVLEIVGTKSVPAY
jgi:hypothetical protein